MDHSPLRIKKNIICWDVDDTLILWGKSQEPDTHLIDPDSGCVESGIAHKEHIQRLKDHKKAGHFNIVWSAGGWDWAAAAVDCLGIEKYVDLICDKPLQYYDDIDAHQFMGRRSFIGEKKKAHASDAMYQPRERMLENYVDKIDTE